MYVLLIGAYILYFAFIGGVAFIILSLLARAGVLLIVSAYEKFFNIWEQNK